MQNTIEKYILFTDLSDYTLKSSLLTPKQLKEFIIDKQDEIILPLIKEFNGELIKYIWDSYLIFFEKAHNSVRFAIKLQKELTKYNKTVNINLKKLELKISINYWEILRKKTKIWYDYYWDPINIASRIIDKTPKNSILITDVVSKNIKLKNININYIWLHTFKWILYKIKLYQIYLNKDELIESSSLEYNEISKKVDLLIFKLASVSFLLTIQPIPFTDIYLMVLLHLYLLREIALLYNYKIDIKKIKEVIWAISISLWWIYSTNQFITTVWKIWLPILWWYLLAPTNFALTYWLWKVFSNYFYYKTQDDNLTNQDIKDIFLWTKDVWLKMAKKNKKKIISTWKKYKDTIVKEVLNLKDLYDEIKDFLKFKK